MIPSSPRGNSYSGISRHSRTESSTMPPFPRHPSTTAKEQQSSSLAAIFSQIDQLPRYPELHDLRNASEDVRYLAQLTAKRPLLLKRKATLGSIGGRTGKSQNLLPTLAYLKGEKNRSKCESCEKFVGPFPECVSFDGYFGLSCTNCAYNGHEERCSFLKTGRPKPFPKDVSSGPPPFRRRSLSRSKSPIRRQERSPRSPPRGPALGGYQDQRGPDLFPPRPPPPPAQRAFEIKGAALERSPSLSDRISRVNPKVSLNDRHYSPPRGREASTHSGNPFSERSPLHAGNTASNGKNARDPIRPISHPPVRSPSPKKVGPKRDASTAFAGNGRESSSEQVRGRKLLRDAPELGNGPRAVEQSHGKTAMRESDGMSTVPTTTKMDSGASLSSVVKAKDVTNEPTGSSDPVQSTVPKKPGVSQQVSRSAVSEASKPPIEGSPPRDTVESSIPTGSRSDSKVSIPPPPASRTLSNEDPPLKRQKVAGNAVGGAKETSNNANKEPSFPARSPAPARARRVPEAANTAHHTSDVAAESQPPANTAPAETTPNISTSSTPAPIVAEPYRLVAPWHQKASSVPIPMVSPSLVSTRSAPLSGTDASAAPSGHGAGERRSHSSSALSAQNDSLHSTRTGQTSPVTMTTGKSIIDSNANTPTLNSHSATTPNEINKSSHVSKPTSSIEVGAQVSPETKDVIMSSAEHAPDTSTGESPPQYISKYDRVLAEVMALTPRQQHEELSALLFRMSALHDAIGRNQSSL